MGASAPSVKAAEQPAAESLLTAFKSLSAAERRRHASVLNYWLSVRGDKEFPPLHDLDPLELSDAGPSSILMELISGGHDAEIKHLGEALREEAWPERIIDAPNPSVLSCIAKKLPIVAISRDFLAFEDEYTTASGKTRCSVTLLPLSAGGAWVDYVYALVSVEQLPANAKTGEGSRKPKAAAEPHQEPELAEQAESEPHLPETAASPEIDVDETSDAEAASPTEAMDELEATGPASPPAEELVQETSEPQEPEAMTAQDIEEAVASDEQEEGPEDGAPTLAAKAPAISKLLDSIAGLTGFYGSQPVKIEAVVEPTDSEGDEEVAPEPSDAGAIDAAEQEPLATSADESAADVLTGESESSSGSPDGHVSVTLEGSLQNKLTQVRAKADEARMARLRANAALYEGLGAAYDFALDAEEAPEEYLRLVEAQGLKIQLRSPMKPVVKLAFAGMCDEPTIKQLEAVLAWAFEEELPRGTLPERIEAAGGIGPILNQEKAA